MYQVLLSNGLYTHIQGILITFLMVYLVNVPIVQDTHYIVLIFDDMFLGQRNDSDLLNDKLPCSKNLKTNINFMFDYSKL